MNELPQTNVPVKDLAGCTRALKDLRENPPGDLIEDFLNARKDILSLYGFSGWVEYQDTLAANPLPHISDSRYTVNHGRSPRGSGRWGFYPGSDAKEYDYSKVFWFHGTYSEARLEAREHFRGCRTIHVCP